MKNFLLIIGIFFTFTQIANAADVSVIAPPLVSNGDQFAVNVDLNTDGASINSVDVSLSYPKEILNFKGYKEDGSIKKLWLVPPKDDGGVIHFSGIIPGGVDGVYNPDKSGLQPIPLAQLLFSPKVSGDGSFTITRSEILQNDGVGMPLAHENRNASIRVSLDRTQILDNDESNLDAEPPEPFTIQYIPSGFFSETPSMISFFTTDTLSGVEKYQIKKMGNSWKDAISPLPTPRGVLKRDVVVRAIDFNGNIRESKVEIPGVVSPMQLFGIFIVFITCYFLFFVVKRKR